MFFGSNENKKTLLKFSGPLVNPCFQNFTTEFTLKYVLLELECFWYMLFVCIHQTVPHLSEHEFYNSPVRTIKFYSRQKISVQTIGKDPFHQTWYFKLKNCKNQVQIDRGSVSMNIIHSVHSGFSLVTPFLPHSSALIFFRWVDSF